MTPDYPIPEYPDDKRLYELFHRNSNNDQLQQADDGQDSADASAEPDTDPAPKSGSDSGPGPGSGPPPGPDRTQFPGAERVPLDQPEDADADADTDTDADAGTGSNLFRALADRRSPTAFADKPIERSTVSVLLRCGVGQTNDNDNDNNNDNTRHRRAYPSAGACYPLETYVCVRDSPDLDHGLYHFDVVADELARLRGPGAASAEALDFIGHDAVETAPLVVLLTADFERTTDKYGNRGYRLVLQESGHLLQNVCLAATALGLGCRPIAGFVEDDADRFLERFGAETTIYTALVGHPI